MGVFKSHRAFSFIFLALIFSLSSVAILGMTAFSGAEDLVPLETYDSHSYTYCDRGVCTARIYLDDRYQQMGDSSWHLRESSFENCSVLGETQYCLTNDQLSIISDDDGGITIVEGGRTVTQRLISINGQNLSFARVAERNELVYRNIVPGTDLVHSLRPSKFKEDIILNEPPYELTQGGPLEITFTFSGDEALIERPYVCDQNGRCIYLNHSFDGTYYHLTVGADYLFDEERVYPLVIDPTISLTNMSISWNGYVQNDTESGISIYTRVGNPADFLAVGPQPPFSILGTSHARAAIEWNLSSIPDDSVVYNATLQLYLNSASSDVMLNVSIFPMGGNNNTYPDQTGDCQGNCQFYTDMGNGTNYSAGSYLTQQVTSIPLSAAASTDVQNALISDLFGIGFTGLAPEDKAVMIGSRDTSNSTRRPVLIIVYGVNATDSSSAIEMGINRSLPANPISTSQQVYLVNENGQHFLGRFDKTTSLGNQTWGFKYVLPGENFTLLPSLFRVLNIWENQSLSFSEITQQVEVFINATRD